MDATIKKMQALANWAKQNAYAPYSNFKVGACIQAEDNKFFAGCNVENAAYGLCICAEASALCDMIKSGGKKVTQVVVVADSETCCAPCGACRQLLLEFSKKDTVIHFFNRDNEFKSERLINLLPIPFSDKTLGD